VEDNIALSNANKLKRGIFISCIIFTLVQGIMCFTGPLARIINPNLVTRDYATIFTATNLLPSWVGGIIFCGIFAAIQSSIAGMCMAGASALAKDFVVDCLKPDATQKEQTRYYNIFILVIALLATIIALKPSDLTQYIINFALGAICSSWYFPVLVGLYWKKATSKGVFASTVGGFFAYVVCYFLSSVIPATKVWWAATLGGVHAFLPAWIIALGLMVFVSLATQKDKVALGYFQVFFCEDYDEKYAKLN
jgi:sodium/pantothenate symporter